jgi:hypothetical protein
MRWLPLSERLAVTELFSDAEEVLHMVADFMGDHVSLGEIAGSFEALAQLAVEGEVDINFLIVAAVKRSRCRGCKAAGRLDAPEKSTRSVFDKSAQPDLIPRALGAAEHAGDELPHLVIYSGLLRLWRWSLWDVDLLHITLQQDSRIEAEKERKQDDYDGTNTAARDPA